MNTDSEAKPMISITCPVTGLNLLISTLVAFFVFGSIVMSWLSPAYWTLPCEVFFQIGLMLASVWLGVVTGRDKSSTMWLQAARQACDSLTALCHDVESITKDQKSACIDAASLLPKDDPSGSPIRVYLKMLCQLSSSRLASVE